MTRRLAIQSLVALVAGVFVVGVYLSGDTVEAGWLRFFSPAVLVVALVWSLWEHWIWRWPVVQAFKGIPRDVRGTWKGTLTSLWKDDAGNTAGPKSAYVVIRQSFATVSVTMFTDESSSRSSLGRVSPLDDQAQLDYMYLNKPDPRFEHRSRIHHGSTSLSVVGKPASRLRGRYWTDRNSHGELDFQERKRKSFGQNFPEDYESAAALF
jgi:hypothetical protein